MVSGILQQVPTWYLVHMESNQIKSSLFVLFFIFSGKKVGRQMTDGDQVINEFRVYQASRIHSDSYITVRKQIRLSYQ